MREDGGTLTIIEEAYMDTLLHFPNTWRTLQERLKELTRVVIKTHSNQ